MQSRSAEARRRLEALEWELSSWTRRFQYQREALEERGLMTWIPNLCPSTRSLEGAMERLASRREPPAQDDTGGAPTDVRETDPVTPKDPGTSLQARPVFVFGCSWRSGSTLLQRLISSTDELFVWGENDGFATRLMALHADGSVGSPELRTFYRDYYGQETTALGRGRWGFKEVRHGRPEGEFLLELFPEARIVFLVRNPIDVAVSAARVAWEGSMPLDAVELWRRNVETMSDWDEERVLVVRYEDLIAEPARELGRVGEHIGIPGERFDALLFDHRFRGRAAGTAADRVTALLEGVRRLREPAITRLADELGYSILDDKRLTGLGTALLSLRFSRAYRALKRTLRRGRRLLHRILGRRHRQD